MAVAGRSVFISYRRQLSWQLAQLIRDNLAKHDFDTFVDVKNLDSGEFEPEILSQIEAREHFIVLLQPGSLDKIGEDGDWLRCEIAHALAHGRNVVPVTAGGFKLRRNLMLPPDVARLPSFNGVDIQQPEYFKAAMKLLRTRFLKTPAAPGRHPLAIPKSLWNVTFTVPVPPAPQLTQSETSTRRSVQLTWSEVSGAEFYVLERAHYMDPKGFVEVYRGPNRSYLARPVGPGTAGGWLYGFRVRASASGKAGEWSNTVEMHFP